MFRQWIRGRLGVARNALKRSDGDLLPLGGRRLAQIVKRVRETGKRYGYCRSAHSGPVGKLFEFAVPAGLAETGVPGSMASTVRSSLSGSSRTLLGVDDRLINRAEKRQLGLQEIQQGPSSGG